MSRTISILFLLWTFHSGFSQNWLSLAPQSLAEDLGERILPTRFQLAEVSTDQLVNALERGVIDLILPDGSLHLFRLAPHTNFASGLAGRYPAIKTYLLQSISNKNIQGRLDYSPRGMHAVIQHPEGEIYLDPYSETSANHYLVYHTKDYRVDPEIRALYNNHQHLFGQSEASFLDQKPIRSPFSRSVAEEVVLRTYRIAIATTGEYTTKHDGTKEGALAAVNTALNRINFVMESELAIRLELIENNDDFIFLNGANDPFSNGNPGQMALENNNYLIANLGSANFDVGHVFGTSCNTVIGVSGGIGIVCGGMKGFGASCEISTNDRFYIGVVCHELGHQFGAEHTWNNCPQAPNDQFNSRTAFEPGSGSTIMSYAGACGNQNIAFDSDNYYHSNSIEDIRNFIQSNGDCAENTLTANHEPTVTIDLEEGFSIPIGTPFKLTASGNDEDGDSITFSWEQFDAGTGVASLSPIENPRGDAPIFRSLPPTSNPTRYFPALTKILNNNYDNTEVLPTYDRKLTFRATVRDHTSEGGGVIWDQISFRAAQNAGPFKLLDENLPDSLQAGTFIEITWDPAKTNLLPVNCQHVNIKLSLDAGETYPLTLIDQTTNDGAEFVLIPNVSTDAARIMIEAADNIFFDINDRPVVIAPSTRAGFALDLKPHLQNTCLPSTVTLDVQSFFTGNFSDSISIAKVMLPPGVTLTSPTTFFPGDDQQIGLDFSGVTFAGLMELTFYFSSSLGDTLIRMVEVNTISSDFSDLSMREPAQGLSSVNLRPTFLWQGSVNANRYLLEVDQSPSFSNPIRAEASTITTVVLDSLLEENTLYYWRIRPENHCGQGAFTAISAFHTINLSCQQYVATDVPKTLSQSGIVVSKSDLTVSNSGTVSDVNLNTIRGFHDSFGDLIFRLRSPSGKTATLIRRQCGFSNRVFNLGFDDQSLMPFDCQASFNGDIFQPMQSLTIFEGEPFGGTWSLEVTDSIIGSGGRIEAWTLELCGSLSPQSPSIVRLDTILASYAASSTIDDQIVEINDDHATPAELIFTLMALPIKGHLQINGNDLVIGDQFSQAEINQGNLVYLHQGLDSLPDGFTVTVIDGEGGWLGPLVIPIKINTGTVTAPVQQLSGFLAYPNPAHNELYIRNEKLYSGGATIRIFATNGALVWEEVSPLTAWMTLNLTPLIRGIYLLQIATHEGVANLRFVKQ